jgi:hypothetical protein
MEQPPRRDSAPDDAPLTTATADRPCPRDERKAAARIPDSVAALSYGTRPLAGVGGGPRLF